MCDNFSVTFSVFLAYFYCFRRNIVLLVEQK